MKKTWIKFLECFLKTNYRNQNQISTLASAKFALFMNRILIGLIIIPLLALNVMHKFYVSVTEVNYVEEQQSVQIITRVFIDDMENLLKLRYDDNIVLAGNDELSRTDEYIGTYIKEKFLIKINGLGKPVSFIGKDYDGDIMRCFIEVEGVADIKSFEISNQLLFDLFDDQQNVVKTSIYSKNKSMILTKQRPSAMLKFN